MFKKALIVLSAAALALAGLSGQLDGPARNAPVSGSYQGGYYGPVGTYQIGKPAPSDPAPTIIGMSVTCVGDGTVQNVDATTDELCLFRVRWGTDSKSGGGLGAWSAWTTVPAFVFFGPFAETPVSSWWFSAEIEAKDVAEQQATNNPQADSFRWGPAGGCL